MRIVKPIFSMLLIVAIGGACTMVDETDHCIATRYGKVVDQHMSTGLNWTPLATATCFSMTAQSFPREDKEGNVERMEAQTRDPVTIHGDLSVVFAHDPGTIFDVFLEKRSVPAVETEVRNAIRSGYRNALSAWSVAEIFSPRREELADSVQAHIQRNLGDLATVHRVFVRDIKIPQAIEDARIQAARQEQVLSQARQQLTIDSVNAEAAITRERGASEARSLRANSYAANPALIDLEMTEAWANGIKEACRSAQTCVLGGSLMDTWRGN